MDDEMKKKKQKVMKKCVCEQCPTYEDCVDEGKELGFCFPTVGKSECITEENGCICSSCPVTDMMGLENDFYCTRGSEKKQKMGKE